MFSNKYYTTEKATSNGVKFIFATGIFPPDIGGPATYTERLAIEFCQRGFGVSVITYSSAKDKKYDFPVVRISKKYPILKYFLYLFNLLKLAKKCDVVYAQNVTSAGLPALLAAKLFKKRLALKIVGDAAWEQRKPYLKKIQECVAKHAHQIIVPSLFLKKIIMGWGVSENKIEIIYNAPEAVSQLTISKDEAKEKIGISGDIILSIGRLVPWKGFADLIAILPDLLKTNPNFRLVIVGQGKEKLKSGNRVKLVGPVPHSQIPLYFQAADVFVLSSGYEGLSHVILEAMQLGVPVIASREGGNPELIEDNFNGLLVEYSNQEQLKQAILRLWQNKELQEKFIQNSKEKIKDFTWENLVNQTLAVLTS